ncbi:hypothetical protein BDK51DRAFT_45188 [Blyttiomyces helicus]|uniref:Uncharacterized protein n=1 Tax=Blyttiomyces helicus TaxID=388810 RepID=A0A4V1IS06_9FUNG|nr:hypothetical protein BDK51DRAFT_45188 [Blyttiomyces helicus]|eukprot:RKO91887.1 hypothetical protein BDK51DRAFT_45188 [Blyttiomyces helicus]
MDGNAAAFATGGFQLDERGMAPDDAEFAFTAVKWHGEGVEEDYADVEEQNDAGNSGENESEDEDGDEGKRRGGGEGGDLESDNEDDHDGDDEKNEAFAATLLASQTATAGEFNSYSTPAPKQRPPTTASSSTAPARSNQHCSAGSSSVVSSGRRPALGSSSPPGPGGKKKESLNEWFNREMVATLEEKEQADERMWASVLRMQAQQMQQLQEERRARKEEGRRIREEERRIREDEHHANQRRADMLHMALIGLNRKMVGQPVDFPPKLSEGDSPDA